MRENDFGIFNLFLVLKANVKYLAGWAFGSAKDILYTLSCCRIKQDIKHLSGWVFELAKDILPPGLHIICCGPCPQVYKISHFDADLLFQSAVNGISHCSVRLPICQVFNLLLILWANNEYLVGPGQQMIPCM